MNNKNPGDEEPSRELATVTHLPAQCDGDDVEIVKPAQWRAKIQRDAAMARRAGYRRDGVAVIRVTRRAVTHRHTITVGKAATRHGYYVAAGAAVLARRLWEAKTNSRYERMQRAAEAAGNMELLLEWEGRAEMARDRRHRRRMDWIAAPWELAKTLVILAGTALGGLLGLGIVLAISKHDASWVLAPVTWAMGVIAAIVTVVTLVWGLILAGLPVLTVAVLWWVGRNGRVTPGWLAPANVMRDATITPSKVVTAFRDLGIADLRKRITDMGDAGAAMLSPIRIAGCGVEFDVTLPPGTSTADVLKRHRKLAENLDRHAHEVHTSVAPQPRTVRVWAAEPGALDEPIGPSPLVYDEDIRADYRRGRCPWGVNLRGDLVTVCLYQLHLLITGLSNQGKTAALRALALWLAFDLRVRFRIADLKGVGDWAMFAGIAEVLVEGPADSHVIAATEMLEEGVNEMERRLQEGGDHHEPLVLIVDEAQVAFMCPVKDEQGRPYGGSKNTSRYFMAARKIHNQGRAANVTLWEGTQDPTDQNLPVLVREGAHLRMSLAVGTAEKSRMALGEKAVDGGAAPHLLRAGLDKGTVVAAGDGVPIERGQSSVTVRTHFIDTEAATELAGRAKAKRGPVRVYAEAEVVRDLVQDVHEVLRDDDKVRASHMADRLREAHPDYRPYRYLDGERLAEMLRAEGVEVRDYKGYPMILARRVLDELDRRQGIE